MSAHFEVFPDEAGQWRWRLRAKNGEIVATSEGYTDENSARRGIGDMRLAIVQAAPEGDALIVKSDR